MIAKLRLIIQLSLRLSKNPRARRWASALWKLLQGIYTLLRTRRMSDIQRGKLPAEPFARDDFEAYAVTTSDIPLGIRSNTTDYTPEPSAVIPSPNTAIPQHSDATCSERKTESPLGTEDKSSSSTPSTSIRRTSRERTFTFEGQEGSKGQELPTPKESQDTIERNIRGYKPLLSPLVPTDIKRYERSIGM